MEKIDHRVCEMHKKHDELQADIKRKEATLQNLIDQLAELQRENEMVQNNMQSSPQVKVKMLKITITKNKKINYRKSETWKTNLTRQ